MPALLRRAVHARCSHERRRRRRLSAGEGEDIEILELPYDRALTMITDGQIADGKTIMLLYWAAVHGPFAAGVGPRPPLQT